MPRTKTGSRTPRGGRGGGRGNARGNIRGKGRDAQQTLHPWISGPQPPIGFTLADEARQTSQHDDTFWGQNINLRKKPVSFISAGKSEPLKQLDESEDDSKHKTTQHTNSENQKQPSPITQDIEMLCPQSTTTDATADPKGLEKPTQVQPHTGNDTLFFFDVSAKEAGSRAHKSPVQIPERPSSPDSSSSEEVILFQGRRAQTKDKSSSAISLTQISTEIQAVEAQMRRAPEKTSQLSVSPDRRPNPKAGGKQRGKRRGWMIEDEDDALVADYIANMRANGELDNLSLAQPNNMRDLGGTESELSEPPQTKMEPVTTSKSQALDVIGSSLATNQFEQLESPHLGPAKDTTTPDDEDVLGSELDDETLAKLIAGNDIDVETTMNMAVAGEFLDTFDSSSSEDATGEKRTETQDEFDFMDWERPSLRRKRGKGARAHLVLDKGDSELEQQLQAAWQTDRMKKSQRKKYREELRALGMLGKNANPNDLRVKYPTGMSMEQVAQEMKVFLLSTDAILTMPPMDKHARKMIHELANKFNVKSKSTGKADQRRPTLHRTGRTLPYTESTFDQAVSRISRRFFPRLDVKGKRAPHASVARTGGTAATIRDGEIVGGSAPELGTDNRGRAMLEKMGWSTGTALGASNNKGILQPVTHAMKRTKAGLA